MSHVYKEVVSSKGKIVERTEITVEPGQTSREIVLYQKSGKNLLGHSWSAGSTLSITAAGEVTTRTYDTRLDSTEIVIASIAPTPLRRQIFHPANDKLIFGFGKTIQYAVAAEVLPVGRRDLNTPSQ